MEPKDYITVIGWIVTFLLGILAGGIIIPRLTRKRKILAWSVMSESDLIPRELSKQIGLPVVLQVGNYSPDSLSVVKIRFGNAGNDVIETVIIDIFFQSGTHIIDARPITNLRSYGKNGFPYPFVDNNCRLEVPFINSGKSFEFEFILGNHEQEIIDVQAPSPGLEIQRTSPKVWDFESNSLLMRSLRVNVLGVAIDPSAYAMNLIVDELRFIRKSLRKP